MSLSSRIEKEYLEAYKGHEATRLGVLRLLKTAMKNRLVELRRPHGELSDEEIMDVILRQAKQRQDSIEQYTAANRPDLAGKERAELEILRLYLPKALGPEEIDAAIDGAIAEAGAQGPKDMGKVMGLVMARCKGQADGKILSARVREKLAAKG